MNIDEPISADELSAAARRVLKIQTKLHQWATDDPSRRFADLFNLKRPRFSAALMRVAALG